MSSLLKSFYVASLETEKKVLNFNDRFEHMASQETMKHADLSETEMAEAEFAQREDMIDGFLAGLGAPTVEVAKGPTAEEIIEDARLEAESILAQAKYEAKMISENARKQADILFENKKRDGRQEGIKLAETEKQKLLEGLQNEYQKKQEELKKLYEDKMENMEGDLVDVLIQVFHKVFGIQFEDKKQILLHLIKNTLLDVETGKEFHIRVSQANFKFIESRIGEIKENIGNDIQIDVVGDATLNDSICIIETESGVFDCSIDVELANLEKNIRSLCR